MVDRTPVTEDELHVYVDGELPADRREAVEIWLANHPEDAARVASWRAQSEMIRSRFGGVIDEPVPSQLALDKLTLNATGNRWRGWTAAAAVVLALAIGGAAGWMARGASAAGPTAGLEAVADEALAAHQLYVGEVRHPIEVKATETHLLPWLSRRLGLPITRAPDLQSFDLTLLGGRLLPGENGPAALFMYESGSGERITLYLARSTEARSSFRYKVKGGLGALRWSEGGYGWVLTGPDDKPRLKPLAISIYEQLDNRAPTPGRSSADQIISRRGS